MNSIYIGPNLNLGLSGSKASGCDGFNAQLLKYNVNGFVYPLTIIYNMSLSSGIVPSKLKIAKVFPIYKSGDENLVTNYRPISLLSVFNKLLEKVIYKRLYSFLNLNNVFYKYQFGFRENHSCSLAVMEVTDQCYENLDKGNYVLGLFVDLKKHLIL